MKRTGIIYCLSLFLTSLCLPTAIFGQNYFEKVYSTSFDKSAREVLPTGDGGYLIAGVTNNSNISDADIYIMKTDASGNFVWGKSYGGAKFDYSYSMIETTDGNYFITGYTQSFGGGDYDIYLLKIDPAGTKMFENKIGGGSGYEDAREIIKTTDGNYMIVGTSSSGFGSKDIVLYKIDLSGAVLWTKNYGGASDDNGNSVKQCPDGGYIIAGGTESYGKGKSDMWLIKTDPAGVMTGSVLYGGTLDDEGISVVANNDGSYVVAIRDSSTTPDIDTRIIKYKSDLTIAWNVLYGWIYKDTPKRIRATNDGGYIVAAISRSWWGEDNPDMWWLKLASDGSLQWTQHFGGLDHEHCADIKQQTDGGYIAVGHSKSGPLPGRKIMFVKSNGSGEVGLSAFSSSGNFQVYPNPSQGYLNVDVSNLSEKTTISISNTLGQLVYYQLLGESNPDNIKSIDLNKQPPGIYLLTVRDASSSQPSSVTKKIMLQR